jgi:hypothetical protein
MQLPGPLRAVIGFAANVSDEAKHLPDRAIELPMLAVSTALQMSLRAQQRYARLTARGDEVLNRRQVGDDPPAWARFDEPIPPEQLRAAAEAERTSSPRPQSAADLLDQLFGNVDEPTPSAPQAPAGPKTANHAATTKAANSTTKAAANNTPAKKAAATNAAAKKAPAKATATKPPAAKAPAAKAPARKAAAKKAPATTAAAEPAGKTVNKPRHTAPSRFDDAGD